MVTGALASIGPGMDVMGLLRAREVAKTLTAYGPLPELPIAAIDWLVLALALSLILAVVAEAMHIRGAAWVGLASVLSLWIYFGPGLWAHLAGDGFFEPAPGHSTSIPWQRFVYQIAATVSAVALVCVRWAAVKREGAKRLAAHEGTKK